MEINRQNIKVRKVSASDIDEMVRHRLDYVCEMQGNRDQVYMQQLSGELTAFLQKSIANGSFIALVAEAEGTILGYGGMILKQVPGDLGKSTYLEGEILNMYTIPPFRRQGVSTVILEELIHLATSSGVSKVALHTSKEGERLYRNAGFSEPLYPYLEKML